MEERRIELPPHSFWVREGGRGTPVVLLHGLSGSSRWWDRNLDALSERHRVLAVDLVGFGRNRRLVGSRLPLSFEETAALLGRWLDGDPAEPVHLVGHSMGGLAAIELAARRPDRVRSLTLVASTGVPFVLDPQPHLAALRHPPIELIRFGPRLALDALRAGPASIALASARLLLADARDAMSRIRMPTLLVWGESDPIVPLRYAHAIREWIPHARLEVVEGAGHVPMWDRAREFDRLLLRFLREVERSPGAAVSPVSPSFTWAIEGCERGICWRAAPGSPRAVLVHGLGIGSRYFRRLAHALHRRGIAAIAPDLPGIGFSGELSRTGMTAMAERVGEWAAGRGLEEAVWIGHSTGCHLVDAVARMGEARVKRALWVAPLWTGRRLPWLGFAALLVADASREPWSLVGEAARAYWDAGLLRIFRHARAARETLALPPATGVRALVLAGARDPMVDRPHLAALGLPLLELPGAHGIVWSHPNELAQAIAEQAFAPGE
ncbi:MAG TPA: alpha/beta fold hydrolase [Thermoanaerobaculia bacterium]|nr:alpha/beta fold hydrolase [Thermoanaerobaculia bacterium]